ncbi:MAG TPA: hypothetical protein VGF29_00795 [Hyphomicrobiaceae bacterium]|jgi:hypothetical protein
MSKPRKQRAPIKVWNELCTYAYRAEGLAHALASLQNCGPQGRPDDHDMAILEIIGCIVDTSRRVSDLVGEAESSVRPAISLPPAPKPAATENVVELRPGA